ncbi:Membrane carboxypeptidase (penicillin-binding protein) [Amycolatopsis arida]|uniref:Membrane carboxypeptidase (Penicillin-binding protein) n=1 Tax=Amycolatopsis arida TaxID=587909 RepID=A0A1I5TM44_9PSEU|nr:transglycosylase domain-containing protein [Amycolatopsis arida]TDX96044.1 membrane peptidoglycan carboxypeptidase [Amycolatopsis arida]SFP84119.1 Membrane carboxypeptidase (penicillin-binding protein) [Amycolatopsis arida]
MVGGPVGPTDREPELLTHHTHNGTTYNGTGSGAGWPNEDEQRFAEPGYGDPTDYADEDFDEPGTGEGDTPPLTPAQRKKRRWQRIRRTLYAMVGLFFVLPALAFTIAYFLVDVPTPEQVAAQQNKVVTYFYGDGTEMGKDVPPGGNRILLKSEDIPDVVKKAVYATEDNTFETNPGFDITGLMRAVWNQVTDGVGGGSTISQQYIKVSTGDDDYTITRKALELVKAFKMNNEQDKRDIITAYLNTIYFGRGAYGVETAARAYYGKSAKELDFSEAALLAGLIQQPGRSENREVAEKRWNTALDRMVANGWLSKAERDSAQFPEMIPLEQSRPETLTGPAAFVKQRVMEELERRGYPEERIQSGGYKVYTTIDKKAQELAEKAVNDVMKGEPDELREALVAVDPKTGGVLAYYGGPNVPKVDETDWADAQRNPGSSFKPFDLVALLQRNKGLGEVYDGSSPRKFGDTVVRNSENQQCPRCTVAEAMERSINTVFYDMVLNDVGVQGVVDAAKAAGIPEEVDGKPTMANPDGNISIGGGTIHVTPANMASAYATFAANGVYREQHFVTKVEESDGTLVFETPVEERPAFNASDPEKNKQIAGNVTKALEPVLPHSRLDCADGRDCAGKTGTHQYDPGKGKVSDDNAQAWMVGYTPSVSTSVWVGTGYNKPIKTASGKRIYGSGLPGEIWKKFMDAYLQGKPKEKFPDVKLIGKPVQKQQSTRQTRTRTADTSTTSSTEPTTSSEPSDKPDPSDRTSTPRRPPGWPTRTQEPPDSGIGLLPRPTGEQ